MGLHTFRAILRRCLCVQSAVLHRRQPEDEGSAGARSTFHEKQRSTANGLRLRIEAGTAIMSIGSHRKRALPLDEDDVLGWVGELHGLPRDFDDGAEAGVLAG